MTREFAIIAAGAMGSAVGRRLTEKGGRVLTLLAGRSPATRRRAEDAGMIGTDEDRIAAADIVLSIVPPGEALALAERLAPALIRGRRKPIFVDCNAVDVETVKRVAGVILPSGARFVDAAIIGPPPKPGDAGPTFYVSGEPAADLEVLRGYGLNVRTIDGPVGAASALKMSYAGITKGLTAIAAAMVLAATRAGAAAGLREELAASQSQLLQRLTKALPDMVPKAYRWVAEMREIAAFVGEDAAASRMYDAFADLYERLAADYQGSKAEIELIERFLSHPE
jgi:3-hydroxyisobutyrate dehydrogenase-like beta-hydroxyacid dehydrogenase